MKVEARLEVDRHGDLGGESVHRLGEQDLAPQRRDRQIQADHGAAASRPGAGSADHGARPDRAVASDDVGDLAPLMLMSSTSQLTRISAPWARAANEYPWTTPSGVAW